MWKNLYGVYLLTHHNFFYITLAILKKTLTLKILPFLQNNIKILIFVKIYGKMNELR